MPTSDVQVRALVRVSELASGNVDMVELIQLEILIYSNNTEVKEKKYG